MSSRRPRPYRDNAKVTVEKARKASGPTMDRLCVDLHFLIRMRIISAVRFQCYTGDALIYEWAFLFTEQSLQPGETEVDPIPGFLAGDARFRVVVTPNADGPEDMRKAWFHHLRWSPASPLRKPPGVEAQTYRTTVHGEHASDERPPIYVQHQLFVNPHFVADTGSIGDDLARAEGVETPGNRAQEKTNEG